MGIPANSSPWDANAILALTCDLVDLQDMPSEQEQDLLFPELINFIRTAPETRLAQTVRPLSQQLSKFRPEQQAQLGNIFTFYKIKILNQKLLFNK